MHFHYKNKALTILLIFVLRATTPRFENMRIFPKIRCLGVFFLMKQRLKNIVDNMDDNARA